MIVSIWSKKSGEANNLVFMLEKGSVEVADNAPLPPSVRFVDPKGVERTCRLDKEFSKQKGYVIYVYDHTSGPASFPAPTPIDPASYFAGSESSDLDTETGGEPSK